MVADSRTGARLAVARREAGLSQRALATTLGVSVRTIQNYEAGRFVPYRHLGALNALLGRSGSWLLDGTGAGSLIAGSQRQRARSRALCAELHERLAEHRRLAGRTTDLTAALLEQRRAAPPPRAGTVPAWPVELSAPPRSPRSC